jgi:hypothetical protein
VCLVQHKKLHLCYIIQVIDRDECETDGVSASVGFLRTDVSEGRVASKLKAISSSRITSTTKIKSLHSTEMSVLTRSTRRYNLEDGVLHSYRLETSRSTF